MPGAVRPDYEPWEAWLPSGERVSEFTLQVTQRWRRHRLAVKHKRQDVANHQPFGEGQGQVLVLAEAKTLPHPFVEGLVPGDSPSDWAGGFGFLTHASRAGIRRLDHLDA